MAEEFLNNSTGLSTDIILEFSKSIQNIKAFNEELNELDARFGSIDSRINTLKKTLAEASSLQSSKGLRETIERELNDIITARGLTISSIGEAPFTVKKETMTELVNKIDSVLNKEILKQISNISVQIDPSLYSGVIPLGKDEFDGINREIARLIKVQTGKLVDAIRKNGEVAISEEDLKGLSLSIGKDTVRTILASVKSKLRSILLNPEIADGTFSFNQSDIRQITSRLKSVLQESLRLELDPATIKNGINLNKELSEVATRIDALLEQYVKGIRNGLMAIDPRSVEVPIENLSKRLRKYIARDLQISEEQLESQLRKIDRGSATGYELRRQFGSLENTINSKLTSGTSKLITQLRRSVRQVELEPSSNLKHYLISEINKLNNEIIRKIREQIDNQFNYMRGELKSVSTSPRSINRNQRLATMMSSGGAGTPRIMQTVINNNYGDRRSPATDTRMLDPYARRDNYFNRFGLEGAIINTIRHIMAGGVVGFPLMATYRAIDSFTTAEMERLKIFQNYMLKDEYQTINEQGNVVPDFAKVEREVEKLIPTLRDLAGFYAIDYGTLNQVAAIASRLTETKEEAETFIDYASMIYRLDNEGDLVNTIAPGVEALMGQFRLTVWEMDEIVKSMAVATNVTKATTDEILKAISRSGSTFYNANILPDEAILMTAVALQYSGESGERIGNMFKTLNTRLGMESVRNLLEEYGIPVYETDRYGREVRRPGLDIYTDLGNLIATRAIDQSDIDKIFQVTAGGYQIGRVMSFIESLNDLNFENEVGVNVHEKIAQARSYQMDVVYDMLAKSMNSNIMDMQRANVEFNVALTSVLEELSPAISDLTDIIVNLSQNIRENSDVVAELVGVLGNTLVGAAAYYGGRKVLDYGGFQQNLENVILQEQLWGGRSLSGRQRQGTVTDLKDIVDQQDSLLFTGSSRDRNFVTRAMSTSLAPYIRELANLDELRKQEIRNYLRDTRGSGGRVTDLADLFMVMDESRGYRRTRMSANEMLSNSSYNARQIAEAKTLQNVFRDFADTFTRTMSDRERFLQFNAVSQNRGFTREFSRMDAGTRGDFINYLERNYASVGKTIENMNELQNAFTDFNREQRNLRTQARANNPAMVELRKSIDQIDESMRKSSSAMTVFQNRLDSIGRAGKALIPTLTSLAKTVGGFLVQLGGMFVLGDIITSVMENTSLTDSQKRLREKRVEIDAGQAYQDYINRGGFWGELTSWKGFMQGLKLDYNSIIDAFIEGNTRVGRNDMSEFMDGFERWVAETQGISRRLWDTDKSFADRVVEQTGTSLDELITQYMRDSGLTQEYSRMERENFMEEYRQMLESESIRADMKLEAQRMREALNQEKLLRGESLTTISETIETIKTLLDELRLDNAVELIKAQLEGIQSTSLDYLAIRKKQLEEEKAVFEQQIALAEQEYNFYQSELQKLEKEGRRYTVNEDGEQVETDEYRELQRKANMEKLRIEEIEKTFGEDYYSSLLELRRVEFEMARKPIEDLLSGASYGRTISDLLTQLNNVEGSYAYYNEKIINLETELENMRTALTMYQAIDPKLDVDGELKTVIESLEKTILEQTIELRNLKISRLFSYREDLARLSDEHTIEMLRRQVALGGVDAGDPALRSLRISQLNRERSEIERYIATLRNSLVDPSLTADERYKIEAEIRDLTKQSLQTQLGIYQEIKENGGTFNLPDGVRVLSQYDYMASRGTHSNISVQTGDTYVSVILPNVTDTTSSQRLSEIGRSIGQGIVTGRVGTYRNQINSSPWNYPTF